MAITFVAPPSGGAFGPGFTINVTTDVVGPIPSDAVWTVDLYNGSTEAFLERGVDNAPDSGHLLVATYGAGASSFLVNPAIDKLVHGQTAELRVALTSETSGVIDSGNESVVSDRISGLPYFFALQQSYGAAGIGGFGSTDRANLESVLTASFATFGANQIPISTLIQAPPIGFLVRERIFPDLSGEGILTRPSGPVSVDAFGLAWEIVFAAPGIGINEGAPDTLEVRSHDLQLVHTLADGNLEDSNHASFNYGDSYWLFNPQLPSFVRYWIEPGVTLRMYWLLIV